VRVSLQSSGGFAAIPALSRPRTADESKLSSEEVAELRRRVASTGFFKHPTHGPAPAKGAADYQKHTLTVEDHGQSHTITVADPIADAALADLIDYVQGLVSR